VPETILFTLNASIVGLAVDPCESHTHNSQSTGPNAHDCPRLVQPLSAAIDCVGQGFVRGIDTANRLLYILTPVPADKLAPVNLLICGHGLELPPVVFDNGQQASIDDAPYIDSSPSTNVASTGSNNGVAGPAFDTIGNNARRARHNIQRKR